jgi:hypothetical protein
MLIDCEKSGLLYPSNFIDEKEALKKAINDIVVQTIEHDLAHIDRNYFLRIHGRFDKLNPEVFKLGVPQATTKLPGFMTNTFVFFVCPSKGFWEPLWMVDGDKNIQFNKEGVAYLQAKQAMPKAS